MRGVGLTEWLAGAVPPELVPLFAVLTVLGDPVLLVAIAPIVYWLGPRYDVVSREDGARLLAITVGALALTVLLKYGFELPRPPDSVKNLAEDGFGFPSGHATGSAAFYGALAMLTTWWTQRTRILLAGGLIVLVAMTRVLLGVHYLVDVVTGATIGLLFAALVVRLTRSSIGHGFRLAGLVGLATPLVAWPEFDAAAAVGGSVGALAAWETWGSRIQERTISVSLFVAAVGFTVFGGLAGATYAIEPASILVVFANLVTGVGFVTLPLVSARLG